MRFRLNRGQRDSSSRKWLSFELLERRDLLAVMRIVDWNTLNGPNDAAGDANFQTVFEAIGNETVQGNTQRVDILALQETDGLQTGGESIERIESILEALYPATDYSFVITTADGGGDSTGFVYDTSTVSLIDSVLVAPGSLTHNVLRGEFRPADTFGESDFFVYSVHLKSGTTANDATVRGNEAALIRADANALNEGANVLIVGDFNMKTSAETAYANLVALGPGQVQDVANAPGNWFNNPAFKSLHSQDPQSTMDDRFDIHFASGEFFDGVGLEYVSNSFHVFGNNGTHTFDMPITTGTGASTTVLNALVAASDHLPVIADYQIIASIPKVRITETLGGTKVIEGGLYDTYQIVLDTVPSANVSVTVTPDSQVDIGNGAGVAKVLTFTPADALTPQSVVVQAADDAAGEGDHNGSIAHTSASADLAYNGLSIASVIVAIVDNDAPKIVINEIDADTPTLPVNDALEFVELYDGGVGNVSLSGMTVVFFNGSNDQSYAAFDLTGKFTDANGFFVLGNSDVTPAPGLTFSNNTLQNGADAVALYAAAVSAFPNGTGVTTSNLLDAVVYDTDDADDAGLLVLVQAGQPQVNENENSSGTTESLSRLPDGGTPRYTDTYFAQAPTPGTFNQIRPVGVQFLQSASRVDVQEGGATDSYQIALQTIPTANVTITVDPDNQTNLGAGTGAAIVLTFTPANSLIPQLVAVSAVDDLSIEGNHTSTLTHTAASADSRYNGLAISNVVANIVDNDVAAPASIVISEIMYNPASDESAPGVGEWIEVVNTGASATDLGGWLFDDEDSSNWGTIPGGTVLNPNQAAVFFDSSFTTAATFRTDWSVPNSALVVGISWGSLSNSPSLGNEVIQLLSNFNVQMDVVNYDDTNPWPSASDGPSIYLKSLSADNNNGANWARAATGLAKTVSPTGATFSAADIGSPGRFYLGGDYNGNGVVDGADYVVWRKTLGSTTEPRADGSGPSTGVPNGIVDQFDYAFWRANLDATGVPNSGSGSGSGEGAGELAAATNFAEPSPPLESLAASAPVESDAVDSAIADFKFVPEFSTTSPSVNSLTPTNVRSVSNEALEPSLLLDRTAQREGRQMFADAQDTAVEHCGEIDQSFTSLDEVSLTTEIEHSLSLL